jgi:hypothetical protein
MKHQAIRPIALMLCSLLVAAVPAQAGTLHFADVLQARVGRNASPDLRLRAIQRGGQATAAGVTATGQGKTDNANAPAGQSPAPDGSAAGPTVSLVAQDPAQQQGGTVETVDLGDITGTVCDCGEIPIIDDTKRGIPPWIWLAGVPLICLTGVCTPDKDCVVNCGPGETPTPTPAIPEPATLLLFGSGLLALGARSRRRRSLQNTAAKPDGPEVV